MKLDNKIKSVALLALAFSMPFLVTGAKEEFVPEERVTDARWWYDTRFYALEGGEN